MPNNPVLAVAEAVSDAVDVDWVSAESSAIEEADREAVRQLRLVAGIGQAARALAARWGPFELREQIGHGSFGTVYRAWDRRLDKEIALKLLHEGAATGTEVIHEAQVLATVEHPNIVPVYGADVHDGRVGIWMKFIRGKTLTDILAGQGPFGAEEAAQIGRELCRALAAVHQKGFVHRDIKAQNVMRELGGRYVLMDFGAGDTVEAARNGAIKGSPAYLAPEVLAGGAPTAQSDIYSLGVLLYLLVSGALPVTASSWSDLRQIHGRPEQRPLSERRCDLPDWFVSAVDRARSADLSLRPATVGELARILDGRATASPEASTSHSEATLEPSVVHGASPHTRSHRWPAYSLGRRGAVLLGATAVVITVLVASVSWPKGPASAGLSPTTVAILPFQGLTNDPDTDTVAKAVSLELTALLGHVGAINVIPWTFMTALQPATSLEDVARRTGADMILEGTVLLQSTSEGHKRLQVRVQVFHAATGSQFWTSTLDRDLGALFDLQRDLARRLAQQIHVVLTRREELLLERTRLVSTESMELYLRARLAWESYSEDFSVPIELFRRAIEMDPNFAEAYAGLAECYALEHAYAGTVSSDEALARVIKQANKAIALDSTLADAWATRAFAKLSLAWDWAGAEADYAKARELSPSSPTVAASYANYLISVRRFDEAIAVSLDAANRSPFSPVVARKLAWAYYVARRYDEAIIQLQRTLQLDPSYEPALTLLARAYALNGQELPALKSIKLAMRPGFEPLLAQVYAAAGEIGPARLVLASLHSPAYQKPLLRYQIAAAYAAMGSEQEALHWLHQAILARDSGVSLLGADPMFDRIRHEAGFARIVKSLNLP